MCSNGENNFQYNSFNYSYDKTWPDLNSVKKVQNQLTVEPNSKFHNIPSKSNPQQSEPERNHLLSTLDPNDCHKWRQNLNGFTNHPIGQTLSSIIQHSSVHNSQSRTPLISTTKPTTLSKNVGVFESFQNQGLVYNKDNTSPTTSTCTTTQPREDIKMVHTPAELKVIRKSESVLRREGKRLEREHLEAIVCGVQAAKPDFSLEQAAADFPALNSTGSRQYKTVSKAAHSSKSCLEYGNGEKVTADDFLATKTVEKSWKPKKKDPIHISLQTAIKSTLHHEKTKTVQQKKKDNTTLHNIQVGNTLDSDQPQQKRGKVRPDKEKKPTKLKCQILLERNERQKARDEFQAQTTIIGSAGSVSNCEQVVSPFCTGGDDELSLLLEQCSVLGSETSIPFSNHNDETLNNGIQPIVTKQVHSRRFRGYCTNCLTEDLTSSVFALVQKIAQFQDRTFYQNPIKATAKRRYVAGISQTNKYLRVKKVKLLVIAPDLEKNCKEGGLDEKINYFIKEAECQGVPCVFGPNRKKLGMAVFKKVFVSCVAILNHEGAEDLLSKVLTNLHEAQENYQSITGVSQETVKEDLESKPVEARDSSLDEISASIIATLREELSPAEKLLKAIERNPS